MQQGIRNGPAEDANECTARWESILKQVAIIIQCTILLTWTIYLGIDQIKILDGETVVWVGIKKFKFGTTESLAAQQNGTI